jgi:hypothetical protein
MRTFADQADYFSDNMNRSTDRLRQLLGDAYDCMQDASGHEALEILEDLVNTCENMTRYTRNLAEQILVSAKLLEESNELL